MEGQIKALPQEREGGRIWSWGRGKCCTVRASRWGDEAAACLGVRYGAGLVWGPWGRRRQRQLPPQCMAHPLTPAAAAVACAPGSVLTEWAGARAVPAEPGLGRSISLHHWEGGA